MFKTTRKKRLFFSQLRKAAHTAKGMLVSKNIISEKSIFDKLAGMDKPPVLPGYPPYLPNQWTLERSKQIVYDIVKKWVEANNGDTDRQEKIEPFFRFAVRRMEDLERKWRSEMRNDMIAKDDFEPISKIFSNKTKLDTAVGIKEFLVASFYISSNVIMNGTVSDYLTWFIEDYTPKLNELWKKTKD